MYRREGERKEGERRKHIQEQKSINRGWKEGKSNKTEENKE